MIKDWCISLLTQSEDEEVYATRIFIVNKDGSCEEGKLEITDE